MTFPLDADLAASNAGKTLSLPFASSEAEMAGIRVTRAEFSRLMGCSKQAVTDWVKSGRITVGADGRLDPRQAVASLLRTGDPARLRAKVLEPLARQVTVYQRQIQMLEQKLAAAREEAEFHEGAANELNAVIEALSFHLELNWAELCRMPAEMALAAVAGWVEAACRQGGDPGSTILDWAALEGEREGGAEEPGHGQMSAGLAGTESGQSRP